MVKRKHKFKGDVIFSLKKPSIHLALYKLHLEELLGHSRFKQILHRKYHIFKHFEKRFYHVKIYRNYDKFIYTDRAQLAFRYILKSHSEVEIQ